eukprot:GHVS01056266.1.p1 GENE.GHVS01056266.1~~GHVS01056266.1.p1  ORF type:complete len:341 (-),score=118.00 GHVS01056266.1:378-1280(-)
MSSSGGFTDEALRQSEKAWMDQFDRSHPCFHQGDSAVVPVDAQKKVPPGMEAHQDWQSWPEHKQTTASGMTDDAGSVVTKVREQVGVLKKLLTAIALPVKQQLATADVSGNCAANKVRDNNNNGDDNNGNNSNNNGDDNNGKNNSSNNNGDDNNGNNNSSNNNGNNNGDDNNGNNNSSNDGDNSTSQFSKGTSSCTKKALAAFEGSVEDILVAVTKHRRTTVVHHQTEEEWTDLVSCTVCQVRADVVEQVGESSAVRTKAQFAEFTLRLNAHGRKLFKLQADLLLRIKQLKKTQPQTKES